MHSAEKHLKKRSETRVTKQKQSEIGAPVVSDFRIYLQREFVRRVRKNPRYSMTAFSKALATDASTLSKILRGKRPLKRQAIERFAARLGLSPNLVQTFIASSPRKNAKRVIGVKQDSVSPEYTQLSIDQFDVISDWYHYAILELIALPNFQSTPEWIARALSISEPEVCIALERLERLEMIERDEAGQWRDVSGGFSTTLGSAPTHSALKNLQRQVLEKAITALEEVPVEKRSQTSMTMAIEVEKLSEARELIKEFQRKMNALLSPTGSRAISEVYHLGVSLYPVSKTKELSGKLKTKKDETKGSEV